MENAKINKEKLLHKFFSEKTITSIFLAMAIALFGVLFLYAAQITGVSDISSEYITLHYDSIIQNGVITAIVIALVYFVHKIACDHRAIGKKKINMDIVAAAVSVLVMLVGIYWINASSTAPFADSENICDQAVKINSGDYSGFAKGQYLGFNRHQLGIVTLLRVMFNIFGQGSYKSFQYLNAIMSGVLCYGVYRTTKSISRENTDACALGLIFTALCVPMYLYVPFVYGEISSTALLVTAAWLMMEYDRKPHVWQIILAALCCAVAVQLRMNSFIVVIGFVIALVVRLFTKRSKWICIMGVSILSAVIALSGVMKLMYDSKYPDDSHPIPSVLYMAMGLMEYNDNQGWFNGYNYNAYIDRNCDRESSTEAGWRSIQDSIKNFSENKGDARDFLVKKFVKQWEAPLFQGVFMNRRVKGEQSAFAKSVYEGDWFYRLYRFMNIYQLIMYGSVLFLLIKGRGKKREITQYNMLIGIFGGALFSLIWEAKTRYILPYFLMMLPYAAAGLECFVQSIGNRRKK